MMNLSIVLCIWNRLRVNNGIAKFNDHIDINFYSGNGGF